MIYLLSSEQLLLNMLQTKAAVRMEAKASVKEASQSMPLPRSASGDSRPKSLTEWYSPEADEADCAQEETDCRTTAGETRETDSFPISHTDQGDDTYPLQSQDTDQQTTTQVLPEELQPPPRRKRHTERRRSHSVEVLSTRPSSSQGVGSTGNTEYFELANTSGSPGGLSGPPSGMATPRPTRKSMSVPPPRPTHGSSQATPTQHSSLLSSPGSLETPLLPLEDGERRRQPEPEEAWGVPMLLALCAVRLREVACCSYTTTRASSRRDHVGKHDILRRPGSRG